MLTLPRIQTRAPLRYLFRVQSDLLSDLLNRVVVPLLLRYTIRAHSALAPESRITLPHFSTSSFKKVPNCAGVLPTGSAACST